MPNYTPKYQFPSPLLSEAPDGPKAVSDLATAVETKIDSMPRAASGTTTFNWANAFSTSATITFPAGRFTATPSVTALMGGQTTFYTVGSYAPGVSTSGATLIGVRTDRSLTTITISANWIAVQAS
jgi:hypothetical protein